MIETDNIVNFAPQATATTAPLRNVALCMQVLERAMNRPRHLPGMVTFYGPSGWGKSFAAAYAANKTRAYYVECKSTWTRKAILGAILNDMGIAPAATIYEMTDQIAENLTLSGRPLIIDEMDHIVEKKAVEIIRDIYEGSRAAILLIGEELLPGKLSRWERFHNRMLAWEPAQPADSNDCMQLARLYCPEIEIDELLLQHILKVSRKAVRRICVNLDMVLAEARRQGLQLIGLKDCKQLTFYTGDAPKRRL